MFIQDVDDVLAYLEENAEQANVEQWGMSGFSTGALTGWYCATQGEYHPTAFVSLAGPSDTIGHYNPDGGVGNFWSEEGTAVIGWLLCWLFCCIKAVVGMEIWR